MSNQLTSNAEALRLFFTEDIYLGKEDVPIALTKENIALAEPDLPTPADNIDFKYLGKNQKNILILVNDEINEVSSLLGRELLRKLVKAINLTANDFALVNYAQYKTTTYDTFEAFFNCQLVLAFGVKASDLALPNQILHQIAEHKQVKMIFTSNLHDLDSDQASKKILWNSLQQLK
ncbi:MAG: hypothetical protein V4541_01315 [Bacteroidota bacterium]